MPTTKFAQAVVIPKKWWQKILFWVKTYKVFFGATAEAVEHNGTLSSEIYGRKLPIEAGEVWEQVNYRKTKNLQIKEPDCKFISKLPCSGIALEAGKTYWVVYPLPNAKKKAYGVRQTKFINAPSAKPLNPTKP